MQGDELHQEGDTCPECEKGKLEYPPTENCSCHINPPCDACVSIELTCNNCGWEDEH